MSLQTGAGPKPPLLDPQKRLDGALIDWSWCKALYLGNYDIVRKGLVVDWFRLEAGEQSS